MLPKFEYGHLYKFAVSLGLLMVALGLTLPWLVLRESGTLLIPRSELDALTPRARRVVLAKQADHEWIANNYRYASVTLATSGLAVATLGFVKWAKRQSVADEIEDAERDTAQAQVRQLTPAEASARLDQESADVLAEEVTRVDESAERQRRFADVRQQIASVEQRVLQIVATDFQRTHVVRRQVRLSTGEGRDVAVDAVVLTDSPGLVSLAIEIKFVQSVHTGSIVNRLREAIPRVAVAAKAASTNVRGRVAGIVVVVMTEEPTEREYSIASRQVEEFRSVLAVPVGVIVTSEATLRDPEPGWFLRSVEAALPKEP